MLLKFRLPLRPVAVSRLVQTPLAARAVSDSPSHQHRVLTMVRAIEGKIPRQHVGHSETVPSNPMTRLLR